MNHGPAATASTTRLALQATSTASPGAASIVLAMLLAYAFGYGLALVPLVRAGMPLARASGIAVSLALAFVAAFPVNRWLIGRGLGHAVVHGAHS